MPLGDFILEDGADGLAPLIKYLARIETSFKSVTPRRCQQVESGFSEMLCRRKRKRLACWVIRGAFAHGFDISLAIASASMQLHGIQYRDFGSAFWSFQAPFMPYGVGCEHHPLLNSRQQFAFYVVAANLAVVGQFLTKGIGSLARIKTAQGVVAQASCIESHARRARCHHGG
ncbi:hypothetical protein ADJ79_01380 [Ottowia sp. oral taxon 894]|nr:hypothetical protein ADJ79_01380 [Ottowia sp. oral taxon 894]